MKNLLKLIININAIASLLIISLASMAQNVGIDVINPSSKLHVNGDIKFTIVNPILSVDTVPSGTLGAQLLVRAGNANPVAGAAAKGGTLILQAGNGNIQSDANSAGGDVIVRSGGNLTSNNLAGNGGDIIFQTGSSNNGNEDSWNEAFRISQYGNVGIGNSNPQTAKLVISTFSGQTGLDLASTDGVAELRVIRNSLSSSDHDLYFQSGAATGNTHFYAGGFNEAMTLTSTGLVGIGTTNPVSNLTLNGGTGDAFTIINGGDVRMWNDAGNGNSSFYVSTGVGTDVGVFVIKSDGKVFAFNGTGGSVSSDARLKQDITPLSGSLDKIMQLNGYSYRFKTKTSDPKKEIGVLAQEVQNVLPEAVFTDDKGYYSVSYNSLVPLLINGIKEQQAQLEASKNQSETVEKENDQLKKRIQTIEAALKITPAK